MENKTSIYEITYRINSPSFKSDCYYQHVIEESIEGALSKFKKYNKKDRYNDASLHIDSIKRLGSVI